MTSVKSHHSSLMALYRAQREARGSQFMFLPPSLTFSELCTLISLEYTRPARGDQLLLEYVARDLRDRGLLLNSPFTPYQYYFDQDTVHDVYITTADGQRMCRGTSHIGSMEAYAKAFGEVFERTALKYNREEVVVASENEMIHRFGTKYVVGPSEFPRATQRQKECAPHLLVGSHDVLSWNQVEHLGHDKRVWIPSQTCFFWNHCRFTNEKYVLQPTTHGAAGGFTREDALQAGIFEIINRHYFLKSWYEDVIPDRLSLTSLPERLTRLIQQLETRGFSVTVLDYSKEAKVPSVIGVLTRDGCVFMGGSASYTLEHAVERAVTEAFSTYLWYVQTTFAGHNDISTELIASIKNDFTDARAGNDFYRVLLYADHFFTQSDKSYDIERLLSGQVHEFDPIAKQYDLTDRDKVIRIAHDSFQDIYVFESDRPYLKHYNYHAVKVIIPNTYYFSLDEQYSRIILDDQSVPCNTHLNPFP